MGALGAAGLLLRRVREEGGILLLTATLVGVTSFLFAAAPRAFNRVADEALGYAVGVVSPTQRNIALATTSDIPPGPAGGVAAVQRRGESYASRFPRSVNELIADHALRVTSVRFLVIDPPEYETHLSLRYQDRMTEETRLVAGRWPVDTGQLLNQAPFELPQQ